MEQVDAHTRVVERKLRDVKSSGAAGLIADAAKTVPNKAIGNKYGEGNTIL